MCTCNSGFFVVVVFCGDPLRLTGCNNPSTLSVCLSVCVSVSVSLSLSLSLSLSYKTVIVLIELIFVLFFSQSVAECDVIRDILVKNVIKNVALKSVSLGNQYHHRHHRHQIFRIFPGWMTRGGSRLSVTLLVVFVCFSVCVLFVFLGRYSRWSSLSRG